MLSGADLSVPGIARLTAEFLDRLGLQDVTVLASCDAFDNFPPGLTGKTLVLTGKLPPSMFGLFMQQMRLRTVRRMPIAFGWLTSEETRPPSGGSSRS